MSTYCQVTILSDRGISSSEMLHYLERFLAAQNTANTISNDCVSRLKNVQESLSKDTSHTISATNATNTLR